MKKILITVIFIFGLSSFAAAGEFCEGFKAGYISVKGRLARVPTCPHAPPTPHDSTAYSEGLKAGIKAAQKK